MSDLELSTDIEPVVHGRCGLGEALADISTAFVQLHKRFYGKGPVRARSYLLDTAVVCLLEPANTGGVVCDSGRSAAPGRRAFNHD